MGSVCLLGILPVVLLVMFVLAAHHTGALNADFKRSLWQAGRDLLHGHSPYGSASDLDPLETDRALYPPIFIMLGLPLAVLPWAIASTIWDVLLLGAVVAALWILGVRDWRCYGIVAVSWPVLLGLTFGNVSLLLVLGVAAVWVWRDRPVRVAATVALLVAVKVFLWPLLVWLFLTRRYRAGVLSAVGLVAALILPWAIIGFEGMREYPSLLDSHTKLWGAHSLSVYGAAISAGFSPSTAKLAGELLAVLLVGAAALYSRRAGTDRHSLSLVILAAIASSPIVWQHYFAMLIVVVALAQPRLGWLWAAFPAMWLILLHAPSGNQVVNGYQRVVVYAIVAATVWAALRHRPEASAGRQIDEFGQFV
jgi:hypothetical protein